MKDLLIRLSENANGVASMLSLLDRNALAKGQLILPQRFLVLLAGMLSDDHLTIQDVSVGSDGVLHLTAQVGKGMQLAYHLKIERFTAANGRADGLISYQEERRGGGLGGALLGMTGKNGLEMALAKYKWLKVTDQTITIQSGNLPASFRASFVSAGHGGLVFRIN